MIKTLHDPNFVLQPRYFFIAAWVEVGRIRGTRDSLAATAEMSSRPEFLLADALDGHFFM